MASEHSESALCFQQAVMLNPYSPESWILLGHQFLEVKNVSSAFGCYKKAIELNKHDHRPWFGLGQLYELLNLPHQSLSLYKKSYYLKPGDSKLSFAVARLLESLGYISDCISMLTVSIESGDQEGGSIFKLAGLLEASDRERAANLYKRFLTDYDEKGLAKPDDSAIATVFLMDYYFELKKYEDAEIFARRGCRYTQSLKHSQMVLEKINLVVASMGDYKKYSLQIPTRPSLFKDQDDGKKENDSEMDMGTSP
ncbi:Cell division cycle protein 23 [Thelohanellus kitauei]|uniref:Cell division cycle protein 23 n=1 Tax=Thelohanellus kitauei TaxID=669202 RepID=A0A0C2N8D8_THEKT|nr:Cell division cycle protein 23 [Thelohanellus kitauei]